jgi:cytochrome c-type biogenesis protein CcmH
MRRDPVLLLGLLLGAVLLSVVLLGVGSAAALEPAEKLADPALESRAEAIGAQLRCLVCQNESIEESGAGLAHDIRIFVRQLLTKGDTNRQVIDAVVDRYGTFVLLKPPVEPATYLLWYGPPALVVLGLAGSFLWIRHSRVTPGQVPLSVEERERLAGLLRDPDT